MNRSYSPKGTRYSPNTPKAIENSTLARWCLAHGETITIPKLSEVRQRPLVRVIDQISAAKAANPAADTGKLEEQMDWLVYDLYRLTNEETAAVADFFWDGTLDGRGRGPSVTASNGRSGHQ